MRKKFTTTMDEEKLKELKKLAVDHDTDAGRMIEKLVSWYKDQANKKSNDKDED
ncbi:hypothetical protein [Thermoflavimicrobium daqui]|uniref:hypothetical protein n=1 Tax=Thermoflavimicrobium daqui TaxID=2137476 RepID=UPI00143CDF8A|nr:hypothetical protein [Thermoflavimicrobium daqui]